MQVGAAPPVGQFVARVVDYLPTLLAGLFVIAAGAGAGWLAKRAIVRILTWLRLDRLAGRVGWRGALGKGDVRDALFNLVGSAVMVVIVLIFLENALDILGLRVLAGAISSLVVYLPNVALVGLIIGLGIVVSDALATRVEDALDDEEFVHARLVAKGLKAVLLAVVGALALWQLDFAREIVLAAFLIGFGAIGVAFALAGGLGTSKAIAQGWSALFERRNKDG